MIKHEFKNKALKDGDAERKYMLKLANMTQSEKDQLERIMSLKKDGNDSPFMYNIAFTSQSRQGVP